MSGSTPAKKSSVELLVPAYVPFEARLDPDAPPDTLHGRLRIRLRRETTFKNVVIDCRGALTILPVKTAAWKPDSRIVYLSSVSLISVPTTLGAGTHEYPFAMPLSADMPCSLPDAGGMARVVYTLRARATKTKKGRLARIGGHILGTLGFSGALENERPVDLARSYPRESVEFQNVHEAEGQWKNKAMYSIALPHRAWAAGDTCMALVKLVPLQKDLIPRQLRITLREDVRIVTSGGPRTFTRHVSTTAVPVVFPKPRDVQETAVDEGPTVTASEPGPFSLAIPTKALPTYRNALITVRHHLDFLVQFGPPEPPDPPGGGVTCRVSMGVRILSSHLLPTARAASLDNRTALFGPMPALMLMRERDNAVSESDSETTTGLPSYADHVADAIPQLVPLVEPSRLAMGLGGLRPGGHHSTFGTITGLSTIGGRSARRFFLMSRVPDYGAAVSVGGIAGIVPLSSTRQLPSYAEAIRPSPGASAAADGNRGERHPPVTQAMRLRAMEETRNTV
ncbi:hypothetical protein BKA62DRAFT_624507 [Auriculariales sp. MPI-PUGE-AT-0066]|nr:hypothetical protein BKA62DRAFT_624507 [Auriculariales sp. MPI-PUGE-AT-0066]